VEGNPTVSAGTPSACPGFSPDEFAPLRQALIHRLDVDLTEVHRAYLTAERWHRGRRRRSGAPFITHPVGVATIVAGLGQDTETVCAALLHDIVDDTPYTRNQMQAEFGSRVAGIVDRICEFDRPEHVAALEQRWLNEAAPLAPADVCVLAVKVADRLHNMQTMQHVPRTRQVEVSHQTLSLVVPLAHRLGFVSVKRELEELALDVLRPQRYGQGSGPVLTRAVLRLLGWLLPTQSRVRWVQEWLGELAVLPSRAARVGFLLRVTAFSVPRLAITLRCDHRRDTVGPQPGAYLIRAAVTALAGMTVAGTWTSPQAGLWVGIAGVVATTTLLACVLFSRDDTAAWRLTQILRAWRRKPDDQ
jgi:hypothetical protein